VQEDFAEAARWFREAAEQGNVNSQYALGWLYRSGEGVPQDNLQAKFWWEKAAEGGLADAQINLALDYESGGCVEQDYIHSAFWYRKAAEQGNEDAWEDYYEALNKLAFDADSGTNRVYLNLDNLLKLDEMLRDAGLDGVKGWGLENLRSSLDGQRSSTHE